MTVSFAWKASLPCDIVLVKQSGLLKVACLSVQMACFQQVDLTIIHKSLSLILRLAVRSTYNLYVWPAITYASTIVVTSEQYESEFKKMLDNSGATSLVTGDTRLALSTNSKSPGKVRMTLLYSRLTTSTQEYHEDFGFQPDERDTPRVDYAFDEMIGRELDSLQPLPAPFYSLHAL